MLSIHRIFEIYGIDPRKTRLVRHGDAELPILQTFQMKREKFEAYQSFQDPKKFGDAKHIATFAPSDGKSALFLGIWDIHEYKTNQELTPHLHDLIDQFHFPKAWHEQVAWYDLRHNEVMSDLSERLIIDWGAATRAWVQQQDKPVVEIRRRNSIGEFKSYKEVSLSYHELRKLMGDKTSNSAWRKALSSIKGVYLIRDTSTGKLYVGGTYGDNGILGRWSDYAKHGDGGNVELQGLNHDNFEFSILEIAPLTSLNQEISLIEEKWKRRLGTREFGHLNSSEGKRRYPL